MLEINPIELYGVWEEGFALDQHILSSDYIGDNEFGHPQFDTKRSEVGELLYQLKYRLDKSVLKALCITARDFIESRCWALDLIVPVPPSATRREQPVLLLAKNISDILNIPVCTDCIVKVKDTPELKNIYDLHERLELLEKAFKVSTSDVRGKKVLLIDDLYRSGATLKAVSSCLAEKGQTQRIYALTMTKARSK